MASVGDEIRNFTGSDRSGSEQRCVHTTVNSGFSNTARRTAANFLRCNEIHPLGGNELAQLMIRHGVGVVTEYTYEIKKLDDILPTSF